MLFHGKLKWKSSLLASPFFVSRAIDHETRRKALTLLDPDIPSLPTDVSVFEMLISHLARGRVFFL